MAETRSMHGTKRNEQQLGGNKRSSQNSFHLRYLELCHARKCTPLMAVRGRQLHGRTLDLVGDKLSLKDWQIITASLANDQMLEQLAVRLRRNMGDVVRTVDTEQKAKAYKLKPAIYTGYVFSGLIESIASCLNASKVITVLKLEGLPLSAFYAQRIAAALIQNGSITELSFQHSQLADEGIKCICKSVRSMTNLELLNLTDCQITQAGAKHIADALKMRRISFYAKGWEESLRYAYIDLQEIGGLRLLKVCHNPLIGDEGLRAILVALQEDLWLWDLDLANCGLTETAGHLILDCLEINHNIVKINLDGNPKIGHFLKHLICRALVRDKETQSKDSDELSLAQLHLKIQQLHESRIKEVSLRRNLEAHNKRLKHSIAEYEFKLSGLRRLFAEDQKNNIRAYFNENKDRHIEASLVQKSGAMPANETEVFAKESRKTKKNVDVSESVTNSKECQVSLKGATKKSKPLVKELKPAINGSDLPGMDSKVSFVPHSLNAHLIHVFERSQRCDRVLHGINRQHMQNNRTQVSSDKEAEEADTEVSEVHENQARGLAKVTQKRMIQSDDRLISDAKNIGNTIANNTAGNNYSTKQIYCRSSPPLMPGSGKSESILQSNKNNKLCF